MAAMCSFCLAPEGKVGTLVAGPGIYICDGCVSLSAELIRSKPQGSKRRTRLDPWAGIEHKSEGLWNLPRIAAAKDQAEANLRSLAQRTQTLGASWAEIGAALGMTRQAAWERFSPRGE